MNNFANNCKAQGEHDVAERLYFECLEIKRRILGAEHPDILSTMNNLANNFKTQEKFGAA